MTIQENIARFEAELAKVNRPGMDKLLAYIRKSDFYKAPASTKYHLSCEGGLLQHSLNVLDALRGILTLAITIEVASDTTHPYAVNAKAYAALLDLLTDICKRNGKNKVVWIADKAKALAYTPKDNELLLTVHRWFANKACPGQYLYDRHDEIAAEVTKRLGGTTPKEETAPSTDEAVTVKAGTALKLSKTALFRSSTAKTATSYKTGTFYIWSDEVVKGRVRITNSKSRVGVAGQVTGWIDVAEAQANGTTAPKEETAAVPYLVKVTATALNVRRGPGTNYGISTTIRDKGVYTIVQEQDGWGKLKSGAGWIKLSYTKKV